MDCGITSPSKKEFNKNRELKMNTKLHTLLVLVVATLLLSAPVAQAANQPYSEKGLAALDKNDVAKAVDWFNKGVKADEADSMFYLGRMYEGGVGVAANMPLAIKLYKQAEEKPGACIEPARYALPRCAGRAAGFQ